MRVFDHSARKDGTFERADFSYDHEAGHYAFPGQFMRKVARSIHEGARDMARDLSMTDA